MEIVLCRPPVNALSIGDLRSVAEIARGAGRRDDCRAVILRAEGKGFNAGGDLKEMQTLEGHDGILGQCNESRDACAALAACEVPVIAAVHGHCLGLGMELIGCCDIIVAASSAKFQFTEVDNGTVGGAPHGLRMFPPQMARYYMLTGEKITAEELHRHGAVARVVEPDALIETARGVASKIAAKTPPVLRRMKAALDAIEGFDPARGMRLEQSMIFELNMIGVGSERRQAFLDGNRPGLGEKGASASKL